MAPASPLLQQQGASASLVRELQGVQFDHPLGAPVLAHASTAPQALLNPAAALAGVLAPPGGSDDDASVGSVLAGALGLGCDAPAGRAAGRARIRLRGVLGMIGMQPVADSNAGTLADAQAADSSQQAAGGSSAGGLLPPSSAAAVPEDALAERHLVSLGVRRLSLDQPLAAVAAVGMAGGAVQTAVHLPVLPEGAEEDDAMTE